MESVNNFFSDAADSKNSDNLILQLDPFIFFLLNNDISICPNLNEKVSRIIGTSGKR